jgi:hypothetical protein
MVAKMLAPATTTIAAIMQRIFILPPVERYKAATKVFVV